MIVSLFSLLPLAGCVSDAQKQSAIEKVNEEFRSCYERTIRAYGSRRYASDKAHAIARVGTALESLGMTVIDTDPTTGYVRARGPAPAPLSNSEWRQAIEHDRPGFRKIVASEVGLLGYFVDFEPQGLDIMITVTAIDVQEGVNLFATMRMVERKPPPSGWPRREYPPCAALKTGVDKLWAAVDRAI